MHPVTYVRFQVFGIGLKITDAAPYQVVSCPNLKDMSGASLEVG